MGFTKQHKNIKANKIIIFYHCSLLAFRTLKVYQIFSFFEQSAHRELKTHTLAQRKLCSLGYNEASCERGDG